jgi:hypothetical protein
MTNCGEGLKPWAMVEGRLQRARSRLIETSGLIVSCCAGTHNEVICARFRSGRLRSNISVEI